MRREIMRITPVMECPVDPASCPESSTPAEGAEIDRKNFEQSPDALQKMISDPDASKSVRVTAVIID